MLNLLCKIIFFWKLKVISCVANLRRVTVYSIVMIQPINGQKFISLLFKTYRSLKVFLGDMSLDELQLFDAASSPLDSFNISAPNCPNADMVQGLGSLSWIHSSCVSRVVSSVSVDAAEWACWGVEILLPPLLELLRVAFKRRRHVHRRSGKENYKISVNRVLLIWQ